MSFKPSQETVNDWLEVVGKGVGILLVLVGVGEYMVSGRAETIVFSTGALFFLGGAGAGLLESLRRPPDPPSKESA